MGGAGLRRRRNEKAPFGILLLLMWMFIPALTSLQDSEKQKCPHGDYRNDEGICCNKCPAGFKLVEMCKDVGHRSTCVPCPKGQYTDEMNYINNCRACKKCKLPKNEVMESPCYAHQNTICRCKDGYYKDVINSIDYDCRKCKACKSDEREIQKCTPTNNTVCGCKENYFRGESECEPCKSCTKDCKHLCSRDTQNTKAPNNDNTLIINIIAGAVSVGFVMLVLVAVVTYMATKCSTKKLLKHPTSQPSEGSPNSCEHVLISSAEFSGNSTEKSSVSEQEVSNLPDCVPLEIKIPDLIYMVLDLVPVLQVKQLVRSLGVKDIEIEQAEMDHRSCKEAHYQMLRVWAEKSSHSGQGGRGGMLHRPLLQELLDKLRKMHLGWAAEELETKYGIQ